MENAKDDCFCLGPDDSSSFEHPSCKGNPATNEWIPAASDMVSRNWCLWDSQLFPPSSWRLETTNHALSSFFSGDICFGQTKQERELSTDRSYLQSASCLVLECVLLRASVVEWAMSNLCSRRQEWSAIWSIVLSVLFNGFPVPAVFQVWKIELVLLNEYFDFMILHNRWYSDNWCSIE